MAPADAFAIGYAHPNALKVTSKSFCVQATTKPATAEMEQFQM